MQKWRKRYGLLRRILKILRLFMSNACQVSHATLSLSQTLVIFHRMAPVSRQSSNWTRIHTDFHRFLFLFHLCLSVQSVS